MNLMSYDENRVPKILFGSFLMIGFILFVSGIIVSIKVLSHKGQIKTYGTITSISRGVTTVSYEVNGRTRESAISGYSSSYYVGKKIKIYYNKLKPGKISAAGLSYLILIMPGIGMVFMLIGTIGAFIILTKEHKIGYL